MNIKILVVIFVVFVVHFGASQDEICYLNSTEIVTFIQNLNMTENDTMQIFLKEFIYNAMNLISLCSSMDISETNNVNFTNDNMFYMCQMLNTTLNESYACSDDGYCVNIDQSIIDSYSDWQCTDTDVCDGLKVALVLTDFYSESNDIDIASSVGFAFILNPITNCIINCINYSSISIDFIVQDYIPETTEATTTTNFYNDTSQNNASTTTTEMFTTTTSAPYWLQCFQLNPLSVTWEINDCSTSVANESYVTCYCPGPFLTGVFWINEDVENNLIPFTVQPCIPITTTVEPSTTTSALENTTTTTLNPSYAVVSCQFSFKKPYNQDDDTNVCNACQNQFNLTSDNFQSCATSNGSTIVNFLLVGDPDSVSNILLAIQSLIQNGKLTITINGVEYTASNDSFSYEYVVNPTQPSTSSNDDDDGLTDAEIAITVVCVVIGVLCLIIIGVFCYISHKKKHKQRPVSPSESTGPIVSEEKHHKHSSSEKHAKGRHNPAFEEEH